MGGGRGVENGTVNERKQREKKDKEEEQKK